MQCKSKWLKQQKLPTHTEIALVYVEKIIALVRQRMVEHPEHAAYPAMLPQLNYIKTVLTPPSTNRAGLHKIDFCTGGPAFALFEREALELYEAIGGVLCVASLYVLRSAVSMRELQNTLDWAHDHQIELSEKWRMLNS